MAFKASSTKPELHAGGPYWIGVDLGGTWAKAWVIQATELGLKLASDVARVRWNSAGFQAAPLAEQRAGVAPRAAERAAHAALIQATAGVIRTQNERLRAHGHTGLVPIALCSAGPKTHDGRGIAYWLNGPRVPDWIGALETALELELSWPARVWDDQDAGALGEVAAAEGALFETQPDAAHQHALYLGIGTGVAEAWLAKGVLQTWPLARAHELLPAALGAHAERCMVALRMDADADERLTLDELASLRLIPDGRATLDSAWECLQALVHHRVESFRATHAVELDRIVIGGKGAEVWAGRTLKGLNIPLLFSKLYGAAALGAVALTMHARIRAAQA